MSATKPHIETDKSVVDRSHLVNRLPIFPLPIFLLAGGMQRLRIFEPKYLSMVASAALGDGFVISINSKSSPFSIADWGAHVKIVDFDMGSDGVLLIDVHAERLVNLTDVEMQNDGVLVGYVDTLSHWSLTYRKKAQNDEGSLSLSQLLKNLFDASSELSHLYKKHYFSYPYWVGARLLEIVPLSLDEKEAFVRHLDFAHLTELLCSVCEKEMK